MTTAPRRDLVPRPATPNESAAATVPSESRSGAGRTRWVELSAALTAVVVSVGSLFVARHQAEVMDRQLAAQVWPLVEYGTSNLSDDGQSRLSLELSNSGVGPTRVRSVRLTYRGRPVRSARELLRTCCLAAMDTTRQVGAVTSDVTGHVLTAGKTVHFLVVPPEAAQRALFRAFNRERFEVAARVCYCSVLDECWVMSSSEGNADPTRVPSCAEEQKAPQYR